MDSSGRLNASGFRIIPSRLQKIKTAATGNSNRRGTSSKVALLLALLCIGLPAISTTSCSHPARQSHSVKFVVHLDSLARVKQVYLTGNNSHLGNWKPAAVPMDRESDSLWSKTLSFKNGETVEYKVTAGSWWTEALGSNGKIYDRPRLRVESDAVVRVNVHDWLNKMENGRPVLTAARFRPDRSDLSLDDLWKYHSGDSAVWADLKYDDNSWPITNPYVMWTRPSDPQWRGVGWFRFHMYVDSSLWNRTLAIRIAQMGASQIYYNGKLLYSFGKVGTSATTTVPNAMSWWQEFRIDPQRDQLIAVRYAEYDRRSLMKMGYFPGFLISMRELNTAFQTAGGVRENAARQMVFTLVPLILFFLHLSLYGFFRKQRQNLYYAICMLGFAGVTYFGYERNVITDVYTVLILTKLGSLSVAVAIFFGLMTGYEMNYVRLPKRFWFFLGMFCLISVTAVAGYNGMFQMGLTYLFFGFTFLEITFTSFRKNEKETHGGWIVLAGFALMSVFIALQILVDYSVIPGVFGLSQLYVYGMMGFAVSMSVFLSYNFARVNEDLEKQLDNVRRLSERAIEQEREAHKLDLERRTIEMESERKSRELESARELQLSLLPRAVPKLKGLDVAAFMKTATEVGGDYYDFFELDDGCFMAAVGDATGHGLKAGNLVTTTKGLLNILSGTESVEEILKLANGAIKRMDLHMLTMCLAVARIRGKNLTYASAGMPPLLVYRAKSGRCEQRVLKAMPLGAVARFPYKSTSVTLHHGDVVAMVSDGLFEIFDARQETYGMENIGASLTKHAGKPAEDIVRCLFEDGRAWGAESQLADDLTIVVIKVTDREAK